MTSPMLCTLLSLSFLATTATGSQSPRAARVHPIHGALQAELSPGMEAQLELPSGRTLPVRVDRSVRRETGWTVSGNVSTSPPGLFVLVEVGGELAGWISLPHEGEVLLVSRDGVLSEEARPHQPILCEQSPETFLTAVMGGASQAPGAGPATPHALHHAGDPVPGELCRCDDGRVIDLLVLHTPAAATNNNSGGTGFNAFVQLVVETANQVFLDSDIPTSLRVVGQVEVAYADDSAREFRDHLDRLAGIGDGQLEEAHVLRDQYAADLVTLFLHSPGSGGVAWGDYAPENGFSVIAVSSSVPTLAHEIGHNLGAGHDPEALIANGEEPLSKFRSYGYGHKFDESGISYKTIMALSTGETPLYEFSNPDQGTGVAPGAVQPAANAYLLQHTCRTVASYRDDGFADCNANGIDDLWEIHAGADDLDGDGVLDECNRRLYVDADSVGGDGTSWGEAWTDLKDAVYTASRRCAPVSEVWVAEGTYRVDRGLGARDLSVEIAEGSVELYGGFVGTESTLAERDWSSHPTVISGDLLGDDLPSFQNRGDNSHSLLRARRAGDRVLIDGVTVRGGNGDGEFPYNGGGALRVRFQRGPVIVRNALLEGNGAANGGAIQVLDSPGRVRLVDCVLTGNEATVRGGAVQVQPGTTLVAVRCTVEDNSSPLGGGVHAYAADGHYEQVLFAGNVSAGDGGGLAVVEGSAVVDDCDFSTNSAVTGGGLSVRLAACDILGSQFSANSSMNGGGIHLQRATARVHGCELVANTGQKGAGVRSYLSDLTLGGSTLSGNHSGLEGGGLWANGSDQEGVAYVEDCVFQDNVSDNNGGAVFIWDLNGVIVRSTFLDNSAANAGGAVWTNLSSPTVVNSAFSGNSAGTDGGSVYLLNGPNALVANCTILDSTPDAVYDWASSTQLANSIVWSSGPSPIRVGGSSGTVVSYCAVEGGYTGAHAGPGIVSVQPALVGFVLQPGSPSGIDAGDSSVLPAGTTVDLKGMPRLRDDPATSDTGPGAPPVVDMGACELQP